MIYVVYLASINLLHFVQQFVKTVLDIVTLDLHHVYGGGGGGSGGGSGVSIEGGLYQRVISTLINIPC